MITCLQRPQCQAPMQGTVQTHAKEPVFIRILRMKFHCFNVLNKNPKEAEMGMVLIY